MPIPEFIVDLRRKIGHDLLWLPAVTAVVLDRDYVLLVRRADNGWWTPVTGIIDPGEEPACAAVREVAEETTVQAIPTQLVWVHTGPPVQHVNGDHAQYLDLVFAMRYVSGEPAVGDDESTDVGWFPIGELPEMPERFRERIIKCANHTGPTDFVSPEDYSGSRSGIER